MSRSDLQQEERLAAQVDLEQAWLAELQDLPLEEEDLRRHHQDLLGLSLYWLAQLLAALAAGLEPERALQLEGLQALAEVVPRPAALLVGDRQALG